MLPSDAFSLKVVYLHRFYFDDNFTQVRMKNFRFLSMFKTYVNSSVLLIAATVLALIIANSSASEAYFQFWNQPVSLSVGSFNLFSHGGETMTLMAFINDFFMAIFFLSVGLEIKREILVGELSSPKNALLPLVGAMGGMIVPVLVFWLFAPSDPVALRGLAVPMATDIAFSLGVISIFGTRVPLALKVFLATLAVADDLGGIVVIATCYAQHIDGVYLLYAALLVVMLVIGNIRGIRTKMFYMLLGVALWYVVLNSGIHATIAGVILAFCIPATIKSPVMDFIERIRDCLSAFPIAMKTRNNSRVAMLTHDQIDTLKQIETASDHVISPLQDIEDNLHTPVSYIIIPLFAFANAGIMFHGMGVENLASGVGLAVVAGLVVGKFFGVFSFSWAAIRLGVVKLPAGCSWGAFASVCMLSGIGFTVALFIADLAYDATDVSQLVLLTDAKFGILVGSLLSGLISIVLLNLTLPRKV